jgi:RNA recognition motif-containing protein
VPGVRLFVGNLNWAVDSEKLRELFSQYGTVVSVRVLEGKGFGFVEMSSPEEAEKARSGLKGTDLMGRPLNVEEAKPQRERSR